MDKSFARLLRNSRLSSYDPTLPQAYRTTSAHKKIGDWGLKRNLPTMIRGSVLKIHALDTAEHQTPFKSALHEQHVNQVWFENFPHSLPPLPKPETQAKDISMMPKWKWKAFLKIAEKNKGIWREGVKQTKFGKRDWLSFMHAVKTNEETFYIDNQRQYVTKAGLTYAYHQPEGEKDYVGPAVTKISNAVEGEDKRNSFGPIIVKGRILNSVPGGWAIGIAGIVGYMSFRYTASFRLFDREDIHDFVVLGAEWNADGRPNITLKPFFEKDVGGLTETFSWLDRVQERELENSSLVEVFTTSREGSKITGLIEANEGVSAGNSRNLKPNNLLATIQSIIETSSPMTSKTTEKFEKKNMENVIHEMDSIFNKSLTTEKVPLKVEDMFAKILTDRKS